MQPFESDKPVKGLDIINPIFPVGRFKITKKYILIEMYAKTGQKDQYNYFYLRPYKGTQTLITAYIPAMKYLEDLRVSKKIELIKFLSRSQVLLDAFNVKSPQLNKPYIYYTEDLSREEGSSYIPRMYCIQNIINAELSPRLINNEDPEYQKLMTGIIGVLNLVYEFNRVFKEHIQDLSFAEWTKINKQDLIYVINKYRNDDLYDYFINHIDSFKEEIKQMLSEKKVMIFGRNHNYGLDSVIIEEEDRSEGACAMILAEVFDESLKHSGIVFMIFLVPESDEWRPRVYLGNVIKNISKMLNNVHNTAWAKIDKSVFKNMPKVTDFWFYSNPYHTDANIRSFVEEGDKTNYGVDDEPMYKIIDDENAISVDMWGGLDFNYVWRDYGSFNKVRGLIEHALMILYEYHRYYPTWKKKRFIKAGAEVVKFTANPSKYGLRKVLNKVFKNQF